MSDDITQMKPIWFFVGWVLMVIGVIVLAAGIYHLFVPVQYAIELHHLHIGIWWGIVLLAGGAVLALFNRKPMEV